MFVPAKGQQPFEAMAAVQTDKTKESLGEMNSELHDFATAKPVTDAELQATVANRTLSLPGSHESLRSVVSAVQEIVEFGYPDDYFDDYAAKVRNVRTADIKDAAGSVIHPDNLIWIVVGDRAKVESGVRALNIGDVHVIDADGNPVR
jgi:zinc protease